MSLASYMNPEIANQAIELVVPHILEHLKLARGSYVGEHSPAAVCILLEGGEVIYRAITDDPFSTGQSLAKVHASIAKEKRKDLVTLDSPNSYWHGGAYRHGGKIVVGVSGLAYQFSSMYASWIAEACYALCVTWHRAQTIVR